MRRVLVALAVALALPSGAQAADYLVVYVNPTKVAPGWTLGGSVVSGNFYGSDAVFGLTLSRVPAGRTLLEEKHALRSHHARSTISFDGKAGRWKTAGQLGTAAVVDMTIEATGSSSPVERVLGCSGSFRQVPVHLEGSFALRTGTRAFGTVKRTRLTGLAMYEDGIVACGRPAAATCATSSSLFAGGARRSLTAAARSFILSFSEPVQGAPANSTHWYHVATLSGYDAVTGTLPELQVTATSPTVRGSATFVARTTTESDSGCRVTTTSGDMTGSFTATFAGWGKRTLRLQPGAYAAFRRSGS
jgi:hypothetical protein